MKPHHKFRALYSDHGTMKWAYGLLSYVCPTFIQIITIDDDFGTTVYNCVPGTEGQYTGLKDRNGKEIYEGDILLGSHMHSVPGNSEVCYIDGMLSLKAGDCVRPFSTTERTRVGWCLAGRSDYGPIEVIGNIYQNPELIPA